MITKEAKSILAAYARRIVKIDAISTERFRIEDNKELEDENWKLHAKMLVVVDKKADKADKELQAFFKEKMLPTLAFTVEEYKLLEELIYSIMDKYDGVCAEGIFDCCSGNRTEDQDQYVARNCWYNYKCL